MRRFHGLFVASVLCAACSVDSDPEAPAPAPLPDPDVVADLRADSNRDGTVSFDESDAVKTTWDAKNGAVFLANIDDDLVKCSKKGIIADVELARCNDAADDVINGPDDMLDLARMKTRPWPEAPAEATASFTVEPAAAADFVRIFKRTGAGDADFEMLAADEVFDAAAIQAGIDLAIEAKDIVRDPAIWDGKVTVRLTVTAGAKSKDDAVLLRVAPVLTYHHLSPAEQVYVSDTQTKGNRAMRKDLEAACSAASLPAPETIADPDPWTQDFFETGYMAMPGPNGTQHVIRTAYRSANVYDPSDKKLPLRPAGRWVFLDFRGKDRAGIQQFDPKHSPAMDSLNSFGNTETIPPYTMGDKTFPFGRLLRGKTAKFFPDPSFSKMIEAQGQQPPVDIDTSWLLVGHVDETLSFVKAKTPRGWALVVNDARAAKKIFDATAAAALGATKMFVGESWYDERGKETPAETTISAVLEDKDVMDASAEAAVKVDAQIAKIKAETGLTDQEIVHIPFLHTSYGGLSVAYQPGMVNGIYVANDRFVVPDPHGPVIDGKDVFKQQVIDAFAPLGITAHFAEAWEYHASLGEVHCGTNSMRKVPETKWWETGR